MSIDGTADLLTGYEFSRHRDDPTLGVLRLDTKGEQLWVPMTREDLKSLAEACLKHADELDEIQ